MAIGWIVGAGVVVLIVFAIAAYNGIVQLGVQAQSAWADIDVQLKRRHDMIPNLVETVKGYAGHEKSTLEAVVNARNLAMAARGPGAKADAEGALTQAVHGLFALAESYPQLRAVEGFNALQGSLRETEDALQNARRYYNAVVRDFNTKIAQFPQNVLAGAFGFRPREFFELANADERAVPRISFANPSP